MTNIIKVKFSDFKELAGNKRVFYFRGKGFYDFIYIVDGIIVKSTVLSSEIENPQQFFSDALFYNAKPLVFGIPDPDANTLTDVAIREVPIIDISDIQDAETKRENKQEAVE